MKMRMGLSMLLATGLAVVSVGPSWAFMDIVETLQRKAEQKAVQLGEHLMDSGERKVAKEADNAINGSSSPQTPHKSQGAPDSTPSTAPDTTSSNQENPQGTGDEIR
ncbi:MAG: hypothetical protein CV089_05675 [Nitrospira sp. WS110]|nr:hypothetical protein [Nitrospira sp. WS110]